MHKVLIIDDEAQFRESLSERLNMRGYLNRTLNSGLDALKTVRLDEDIDVVILDRKMPEMQGEEVLKDIKRYRPEIQVIMLTGHGTHESAMEVGKLDAFRYVQKPCEIDKLIEIIEEARRAKVKAMGKHEIPVVKKGTFKDWLTGTHNSRPGILILGFILFAIILLMPAPQRLTELISYKKTGEMTDVNMGYSDYRGMKEGENIADYYGHKYKLEKKEILPDGKKITYPLTVEETTFRAKVMIGVLIVAVFFWATGAMPIGVTALLVGVFMYLTGVMKPNDVAASYVKDSVIFIFGVLAFSKAITKTGLDRRIGLMLLGSSKSIKMFLFLFLPLFGTACSFLSEHALVAFIMPVLLIIYLTAIRSVGLKEDYKLAVMLFLAVNFVANCGGPGSPAAGGRNAIMLGILSDYGTAPSFGQWVQYGLPFVPVMALVVGVYFYFACYRKSAIKKINVSKIIREASDKIGPMTNSEYVTAGVLILLILLLVTSSDMLGMGGPLLIALVLLNVFRILAWRDVAKVQWEVIALYAAATAMGKGLAVTGAALYIADSFISILPEFMTSGEGLAMAAAIFTGVATNFMSDGATVSAIGPITVPMAMIAGVHPWMVGLITAFSSSFAFIFIIGTPNNAIVYAMAKNPTTGEQLVKLGDFLKHGIAVWLLSMLVLFFWVILGYWQWIGF
jgi:sodium-dependent dicarboxylate transporter 2/3/5